MAKSESATPETSLGQAGMPPSYGMGIREGNYGNGNNWAGGSAGNSPNYGGSYGYSGQSGTGPSPQLLQLILGMVSGNSGGGFGSQDRFGGYNGMGGPSNTRYNFGTPVSGAGLFSGLPGATGGSQQGQRLTDPFANSRPQQFTDNSKPTPRG
jgi:hypothetical protein